MSFSTKWKLEVYKKSYECEDHWQLRRNFMLEHKNTIPEDELVCLAQVFINVEILGCRYSAEIMQRIAELSKNVAADYRKSRKHTLKRNFVGASDAASSNVKKTPAVTKKVVNFPHERDNDLLLNEEQLKLLLVDLVYFDGEDYNVKNNFGRTIAELKKANLGELREDYLDEEKRLKIYYRDHLIFSYTDLTVTKKEVKRDGFLKLAELFRKYCYSIKTKKVHSSTDEIERIADGVKNPAVKAMKLNETNNFEDNKLQENNIGFKMLKSLGWTGGALGKDGIVDPIGLKIQIGRLGLGEAHSPSKKKKKNDESAEVTTTINIQYYRNILRNFKKNNMDYELVFAAEFTSEERAMLHMESLKLGLKTKSYGKNEERHLVVRKNINTRTLKERLLEGDPILLDLYDIVPPTNGLE